MQGTDFFQRQDAARKRTRQLIALFVLAVLGIIGALYVAAIVILGGPLFNLELLLGIALLVIVVVGGGSLYKISVLAKGGSAIAEMLGGQLVDPSTKDPKLRQLLNIIEEMAIASGIPAPATYVLRDEEAINAFAAGFSPSDAAVGITLGALKRLTRDEIQGVIAHEFSHILNGDMRLNIRLMGVLFGILCLAILGRILIRGDARLNAGGSSRRWKQCGVGIILMAGLALSVIGYIGVFFAKLIRAAVSRQREFLADAAAVQFTRNPAGIAGALYKIGRFSGVLRNPHAEEASHLFFGNGLPESWLSLFSTHPPISERIKAIYPGFDPENVKIIHPPARPLDGKAAPIRRNWLGQAGELVAEQLAVAGSLISSLPQEVRIGLHEIDSAQLLIFSLLLDENPMLRARQLATLHLDQQKLAQLETMREQNARLSNAEKITMIDLAISALRHMEPADYRAFRAKLDALIAADDSVNLFEYLLQRMLRRHLDRFFIKANPPPVVFRTLRPVFGDIAVLLSALAYLGGGDEEARARAYAEGVRELLAKSNDPALQQREAPSLRDVDEALNRLEQTEMTLRRRVLLACGQTVMSDGRISEEQAQLLRIIADALDCPVPPFVRNEQNEPWPKETRDFEQAFQEPE